MQAGFIIKNKREGTYNSMIWLLVILHFIFFIFLIIDNVMWKKAIAGLIAIAVNGAYNLWFSKLSGRKFHFSKDIFIFFGILFGSTELWWLLLLEICLYILFKFYFQIRSISFSPFIIEYNAKPHNKKYKWNEFSNVILKDNILTLDFKNNKLLQAEIEHTNVDQEQFNSFALSQLQTDNH